MKIVQVCFVAIAVALVACVSHAGLFDTIKSVANEAANVAEGFSGDQARTSGPINQFLNGEFKSRYSKIKPDYNAEVLEEINDFARGRGVNSLVFVRQNAQYGFVDQLGNVSAAGLSPRPGCHVIEQTWLGHAENWLSAQERDYEEAKRQAQLAAQAKAAAEKAAAERKVAEERRAAEERKAAEERRIAEEKAAAEARRRAENARKAKQAKVAASLSAWERRLTELGYTADGIQKLMPRIENLLAQSEFGECREKDVMSCLNIRDQREVAKDAAAAKKINLNDPKTLSENDKIIIAHIDQELVPRLMFKGAVSKQELDQLKIQLLVQIHKVQEDLQVQAADLQIKEIIRMHNL